ncbi:hypothetical protein RRG08_039021 [Elysia crispata]|uniref:Uncharacterized protein n=1 Tax=Elysia crispata TaxID=231223 RepID=A0AAE1AUG1_9GAST|nr:hypothetical protein RRG08_039021 [Elysia crispata]
MGNQSSNRLAEANDKKFPQSETQMDSILIKGVILPVHGKVHDINLGLVNSVKEEIDKLLHTYNLNIPASECQLVIENNGCTTVMEANQEIEYYLDKLTRSSSVLRLLHSKASQNSLPNISTLGVNLK